MAQNDFEGFLQAILDRGDLQEKLKTQIDERGIDNSGDLADLAVEIGTELGFDFTRETAQLSIDELIAAEQQGAELTNHELDRVAGGAAMDFAKDYAADSSIGRDVTRSFRLNKMKIGR
jgi:hypothetical protein